MGILRQLSFWKRGNSKLVPFDERSESRVPEVKADLKSAFSSCDTRLEVQRFRTSTPASSPSESTCSGASESPADAEVEPSASGESAAFSPFDLVDFNASQQEISRAVAHEFGEEVASSLQSTKWDKRLRSLQSISSMLAGRDLEGGKTTKSRTEDFWEVPAWRASCLVLHQVLRDKVIPVNLAALELFRDTFEDLDEAEPEVRHAVGVLIDQVTSRLGDSNVRLHEAARRDVVFAARLLGLPDLLRRLRSRLEVTSGCPPLALCGACLLCAPAFYAPRAPVRLRAVSGFRPSARAADTASAASAASAGRGRDVRSAEVARAGFLEELREKMEEPPLSGIKSPGVWLALASVAFAGFSGGNIFAACAVGGCALLGSWFGRRTPLGRAMTGPVSAFALSVILSSQWPGGVPAAVLRRLQFAAVTLATPLLLLSCNVKELLGKSARRLLGAFCVGAISTALGAFLAAVLLHSRLTAACGGWENAASAVAALTSKNIGSGINFVAVAQALAMKPMIIAASLAVDSALGLIYFPVAASITPTSDEEEAGSGGSSSASPSLVDCASTLLVALGVAFVADQISPRGYACITSSVLAVALGSLPGAAERYPAGEALGWPILYIYFAAAGFMVGSIPGNTLLRFSALLDFGIVLTLIHVGVLLSLGRLCGFSRGELMVASSANIGGPATANSLATAKNLHSLRRPALLVGTFGPLEAKGNERNKVHFGVLDTVSALLRAESGWAVEDITGFITLGLEETSGPRIRKAAISLAETVYRLRGAESAEVLFANLRSAKRNLLRQRFEEVDEEQRSEEGGEERPDLDDFLCAAPIRALASASASAALPGAVPQGEEESLMDGILEETGLVFQGAGIANERRGRKSVSFCQFPD
ncbi:unnamed protein product, partial [Effrenium voratum]